MPPNQNDQSLPKLLLARLQQKEMLIIKLQQQVTHLTQAQQDQDCLLESKNFNKLSTKIIGQSLDINKLIQQIEDQEIEKVNLSQQIEDLKYQLLVSETYQQQYELTQFEFEREVIKSTQLKFDNEKLSQQIDYLSQEIELRKKNGSIECQQLELQHQNLQGILYQEIDKLKQQEQELTDSLQNIKTHSEQEKSQLSKDQILQDNMLLQMASQQKDEQIESLKLRLEYFVENFQTMGDTVKNAQQVVDENEYLKQEITELLNKLKSEENEEVIIETVYEDCAMQSENLSQNTTLEPFEEEICQAKDYSKIKKSEVSDQILIKRQNMVDKYQHNEEVIKVLQNLDTCQQENLAYLDQLELNLYSLENQIAQKINKIKQQFDNNQSQELDEYKQSMLELFEQLDVKQIENLQFLDELSIKVEQQMK